MKIHATNFLIAVAVCALLTYGIMNIDANAMKATTGVGAFISLASTLALAIGVSFDNGRVGTNMRVVAMVFFVGALLLNALFAFVGLSQTSYIITSGIFFLVYVLVANALFAAKH
jgi:hypothetical protein